MNHSSVKQYLPLMWVIKSLVSQWTLKCLLFQSIHHHHKASNVLHVCMSGFSNIAHTKSCDKLFKLFKRICSKDTILSNKAIYDVQHPLGMDGSLKSAQHVVVPEKHAARWRRGARVGPHLALQGQREVIGVAEVEVTGQVNVLEHLQVPAGRKTNSLRRVIPCMAS